MKAARLDAGTVVEILTAPEGVLLSDCFHPDILTACIPCGDDAQVGWVYENGVLYDPANPPVAPIEPAVGPVAEAPVEEVAAEVPSEEPVVE